MANIHSYPHTYICMRMCAYAYPYMCRTRGTCVCDQNYCRLEWMFLAVFLLWRLQYMLAIWLEYLTCTAFTCPVSLFRLSVLLPFSSYSLPPHSPWIPTPSLLTPHSPWFFTPHSFSPSPPSHACTHKWWPWTPVHRAPGVIDPTKPALPAETMSSTSLSKRQWRGCKMSSRPEEEAGALVAGTVPPQGQGGRMVAVLPLVRRAILALAVHGGYT